MPCWLEFSLLFSFTLGAIPYFWYVVFINSHALIVKPLHGAHVVLAPYHISIRHLVTIAVGRFLGLIWIRSIILLHVTFVFIRRTLEIGIWKEFQSILNFNLIILKAIIELNNKKDGITSVEQRT